LSAGLAIFTTPSYESNTNAKPTARTISRTTLTSIPGPARRAFNSNRPRPAKKTNATNVPAQMAERKSEGGAATLEEHDRDAWIYGAEAATDQQTGRSRFHSPTLVQQVSRKKPTDTKNQAGNGCCDRNNAEAHMQISLEVGQR